MIKSILLAADASKHSSAAREHALELAATYGARLTAVNVLDVRLLEMPPYLDYAYPFETIPPAQFPVELLESFRVKAERVLEEARLAAEDRGVKVETRLEEGVPGEVLAELGDAHDLIVIGKRGEHARWGKDMLGTVTEELVRRATTPVLLADEEYRPLRSFLLLYDGSHPANQALKLTADMAAHLKVPVKVMTSAGLPEQAEAVQQEARKYLEAVEVAAVFRQVQGPIEVRAAEEVEAESIDLTVIGRKGYSILHRLILGSSAEQLMRDLPTPVLLVP
ncbi:MAG: universal stress protein [Gaiellales bacterium]|nr:universal stress protein [Gaiellales bacterium]